MLERAVALACDQREPKTWANQIPVASGLVPGAADGRRAIDLAERRNDGSYELIELKIASDTPLYAAVELLGYASLWLLARHDPPAHQPDLLAADRIDLRVLVPAAYYAAFDVVDLERSLQRGVDQLGQQHRVDLAFGYDVLPDALTGGPLPEPRELLVALAERFALHGTRRISAFR